MLCLSHSLWVCVWLTCKTSSKSKAIGSFIMFQQHWSSAVKIFDNFCLFTWFFFHITSLAISALLICDNGSWTVCCQILTHDLISIYLNISTFWVFISLKLFQMWWRGWCVYLFCFLSSIYIFCPIEFVVCSKSSNGYRNLLSNVMLNFLQMYFNFFFQFLIFRMIFFSFEYTIHSSGSAFVVNSWPI